MMPKKDDNTLLYMGLGAAALYVFARPSYEDLYNSILGLFGKGGKTPPADTSIPVSINDPSALENWTNNLPHTVDVVINNSTQETYKVYVGMSILDINELLIKDYPAKSVTLPPGNKTVSWIIFPWAFPEGLYNVISATYDKYPAPGANTLGIHGVTFNYV